MRFLLVLALALVSQASAQMDQDQNLVLRPHRLLQRARTLPLSPQVPNQAVEDLLSQLLLPEDETRLESNMVSMATGGAKEELRMELERSAEPPNSMPPRERKAGCKNFYWKGFTSC